MNCILLQSEDGGLLTKGNSELRKMVEVRIEFVTPAWVIYLFRSMELMS